MKRSQRTWGLTALVVVVVGYAAYDYRTQMQSEKEKDQQSLLLDTPSNQIAELSISGLNGEIHLKKTKDGWTMLKPVLDQADSRLTDQFVEGLATEKSTEVAVEGDSVDFSGFGLDKPKGWIQVTSQAGGKTQYSVGSLKNFQGDAFLRKNDDKRVLIVSSTWFAKLEKKPEDFRDKRLMRFPNSEVEKISFTKNKGKEKFELIKKDSDWILAAHPEWKLDQNRVRELLSMLNTTEAIEFISDNNAKPEELKKWGLLDPRLKLTVDLKDKRVWTAGFAAGRDKVHRVQVSEPAFVLKISPTDSDKFYRLSKQAFRDTSAPFHFNKQAVQKIDIQTSQKAKSLRTEDEKSKDLLVKVGKLSIFDFSENPKAKLDQFLIMKGEDDKEVFRMQWGNPHQIKINGESVKVLDAKTSTYPHGFKILENDVLSLSLVDENETGTNNAAEKKTDKKESLK